MKPNSISKNKNNRGRQPKWIACALSMFVAFGLLTPICSFAQTAGGQEEIIYEDVPDMPQSDVDAVMNWIKNKTTGERLPFCWRQSYPNSVGKPLSLNDCPNGGERKGADLLCYPKCKDGYYGISFVCWAYTPGAQKNWATDSMITIYKPEPYGRGTGWAGYSDVGGKTAIERCEAGNLSKGDGESPAGQKCEMNGAYAYPKCKAGFHNVGCCICSPDCPKDWTDTGVGCTRPSYTRGAGEILGCQPFYSKGAADLICYPNCKPNFHIVGPVCWQNCAAGWTECAAGCAKTKGECASVVVDQVISPLILAANIATLGLSTPVTGALEGVGESLTIGSKTFYGSTKTGAALIKFVKTLQTVRPAGLAKDASLIRRIFAVTTGVGTNAGTVMRVYKFTKTIGKISLAVHSAGTDFKKAYADDFAAQTSPEINREIDRRFQPEVARYLKESWGNIQLKEMAGANDFQIAQDVLTAVSIVDISGTTGVVSAYTKPICQDILPFPTLSQAYSSIPLFDGSRNTACRGANDGGNPKDPEAMKDSNIYFDLYKYGNDGQRSLKACEAACKDRCTGFEYNDSNGRCELWKVPITDVVPSNGSTCFKKP